MIEGKFGGTTDGFGLLNSAQHSSAGEDPMCA